VRAPAQRRRYVLLRRVEFGCVDAGNSRRIAVKDYIERKAASSCIRDGRDGRRDGQSVKRRDTGPSSDLSLVITPVLNESLLV
jgi:hypothetical protein